MSDSGTGTNGLPLSKEAEKESMRLILGLYSFTSPQLHIILVANMFI